MTTFFSNTTTATVTSNRILYTASSFARSTLLHLQEIGELEAKRSHTSKREGLQSYLFFAVVSGSGCLNYQDKNYPLSPGSCVFIDCHNSYSHTTDPHNLWTLRWIHFNGPTMNSVYNKYRERGGQPVFKAADSVEYGKQVDDVWASLMTVASGHDYMRDMLINQYLSELLVCLMKESWHPENQEDLPKKKGLIVPVKEYLDSNYKSKITLDFLADRFFINKYYLTKTFKEQYGVSINAYLLSVRITKAKQLLRFSDKSIEEIGFECGLGAPHYFSTKFKEIEGVPPSVYREQW